MPTFATVNICATNSARVSILLNDLQEETNYHSINPLKSSIEDLRHVGNELILEVFFKNAKNMQLTTKTIFLANYVLLKEQGVLPIESVGASTPTTIEELEQALITITAP